MKLVQVTKENEQYFSKDFIQGFNAGAKAQYETDKEEKSWIPISKQVPKEGGIYIVSAKVFPENEEETNFEQICIASWQPETKAWYHAGYGPVTAWMPLPKTYEES